MKYICLQQKNASNNLIVSWNIGNWKEGGNDKNVDISCENETSVYNTQCNACNMTGGSSHQALDSISSSINRTINCSRKGVYFMIIMYGG